MKKKRIKKLQLSTETLRDLTTLDAQKVIGGDFTPQTGIGCCPTVTEGPGACPACWE